MTGSLYRNAMIFSTAKDIFVPNAILINGMNLLEKMMHEIVYVDNCLMQLQDVGIAQKHVR